MSRTRSNQRNTRRAALLVMMLAFCGGGALAGHAAPDIRYQPGDLKALQDAFEELATELRPGVVAIRTYIVPTSGDAASGLVKTPHVQGTGFVIDPAGLIATNHHVIEGAGAISVILHTGQEYDASVRQSDLRSDLAVLKIDAEGLAPLPLGDLSSVKVGQWTLACGNPFGLANRDGNTSVVVGVVSALGREMTRNLNADPQSRYYGNLIETSAPIHPGGSGGPLFNIDGEVIGVVTAIEVGSEISNGVGFAIPIDRNTRRILSTLKEGKAVRYGFMGVRVEDVPRPRSRRVADTRGHAGARIVAISPPDGPAAEAGLRADDVLLKVNGTAIEDSDHLVRLIQYTPSDTAIEVTFLRKNVKRRATVTLADRNELLGLKGDE